MQPFLVGHATHPDWRGALALAGAQLQAGVAAHERSAAGPLNLGLVYFSDHYASEAQALYDALKQQWPGVSWAGSVGIGVAASGVEYFDEPALVLMLAALPFGINPADQILVCAHRADRAATGRELGQAGAEAVGGQGPPGDVGLAPNPDHLARSLTLALSVVAGQG